MAIGEASQLIEQAVKDSKNEKGEVDFLRVMVRLLGAQLTYQVEIRDQLTLCNDQLRETKKDVATLKDMVYRHFTKGN